MTQLEASGETLPVEAFATLPGEPSQAHEVAFYSGGVLVLRGRLMRRCDLDGFALESWRLPDSKPQPAKMTVAGARVLVAANQKWVVDWTRWQLIDSSPYFHAVISSSGQHWALRGLEPEQGIAIWPVGDQERRYPPPVPANATPLWVSDERDLVFGTPAGVFRYSYQADESQIVVASAGLAGGGAWHAAPDASTFVYTTSSQLRAFNANGQLMIHLKSMSGWTALAIASGGRIAAGTYKGRVFLLEGERKVDLIRTKDRISSLAWSDDGTAVAWGSPLAFGVAKVS